jgi:hypothetical protein
MNEQCSGDFERLAHAQGDGGIIGDLWQLVWRSGKWWLLPVLVMLLLVGLVVLLSGSAAAPFIYALF